MMSSGSERSDMPMTPPSETYSQHFESLKMEKVNRPENSDWAQQSLKSWQPMLTLKASIYVCCIAGSMYLALALLVGIPSMELSLNRVVYDGEVVDGEYIDFSERCLLRDGSKGNSFSRDHVCYVNMTVKEDIESEAFVFYEIGNYFQNHRRFVTSWIPSQFVDEFDGTGSVEPCSPVINITSRFCRGNVCDGEERQREPYPCGLIANSMFNDIFWLHDGLLPNGTVLGREDLVQDGIARKYLNNVIKNPTFEMNTSIYLPIWNNPNFSRIIPPVNGDQRGIINEDYHNSTAWGNTTNGLGMENEHWRVWVDLSAKHNFRKPYGIIKRKLPKGTKLVFAVQSNFYVQGFKGYKAIIVGELSWFGSENLELAILLGILGILFLLAALLFIYRQCTNARSYGDANVLAWKQKSI